MADIISIKFNLPKENVRFNLQQISELDSITLNMILGSAPITATAEWGRITGDINEQSDLIEMVASAFDAAKSYTDSEVAPLAQDITELDETKVDKIQGKGLSSNDYTDEDKNKLSDIEAGAEVNVIEGVKVNGTPLTPDDKIVDVTVPIKTSDLTNDSDFITSDDIADLATTEYVDDGLAGKVDKVQGKQLSTNDYIDADKQKVADALTEQTQADWDEIDPYDPAFIKNKPTIPEGSVLYHSLGQNTDGAADQKVVTDALNTKVDKVEGKGLSTNDFTTAEQTKLANLENYDDTAVYAAIAYEESRAESVEEALAEDIADIKELIPSTATSANQLADKAFVNSSLNSVTAYYITKDAQGTQFASKADLDATTTFYSGGEVRVPTRNDYCIVLADETKTDPVTGENPTTRYIYQTNGWEYQYTVNKTTLTAAQLATLNSGLSAQDKTTYDAHLLDNNNPHTVTKSQVGLGNVPNVATNNQTPTYTEATELTALSSGEVLSTAFGKIKKAVSTLISHLSASNPHGITKSTIGLGNVDNTSDANKPISTATQNALDTKVDKVTGKGLSANDYTTTEKNKLSALPTATELGNSLSAKQDAVTTSSDTSALGDSTKVAINFTSNKNIVFSTCVKVYNYIKGKLDSVYAALGHTHTQSEITDFPSSIVTGVKGNSESTYRNGQVNITKTNIGLGNVGDFKAVSTEANQGLTNTEKANARTNIGAGTSSFSGNYNDLSNRPDIPTVVDTVSDSNMNAVTSNAVYDRCTTLQNNINGKVGSTSVTTILQITAAAYNALSTKVATTLYLIIG